MAVNVLTPSDRLAAIDAGPLDPRREIYRASEPLDLRGPILMAAMAMLLIDTIIVFVLAGGLARLLRRRHPAVAAILALCVIGTVTLAPHPAFAQNDPNAIQSTLKTRLAYVVTGDAAVDGISKTGLQGLTLFLAQRTALEAGDPIGLDLGRDELSYYPLIYWPIVPGVAKPSPQALQKLEAYMKQGGTVLFDTRDAVEAPPGPGGATRGPGMLALREILSSLDIPELEPMPREHVLTKTFYLLRNFPGRFSSGQLWVEALPDAKQRGRPHQAGARRRRRVLDHHHVERSCRRMGDAAGRPAGSADGAGRYRGNGNSHSAPASTS